MMTVDDRDLPPLPVSLARYDCRTNRLLLALLKDLRANLDPFDQTRVGVVIGTSGSGIANGEVALQEYERHGTMPAFFHYKQQEIGGAAEFASRWLGTRGPTYTLSTSCASGAHALISARNLLRAGICDAVVAGGVDTLSSTTVQGFASLGALSSNGCNPFSRHRDGTVLGEGGALLVMSRERAPLALLGAGMSSDAYHLSAPDPEGQGAQLAMCRALAEAGVSARQIGYLNLHGTGTFHNDAMEARAVQAVFSHSVPPCSSTKPLTGHCLGAAGALEAAFCANVLLDPGKPLPRHCWDGDDDPAFPALHFTDGREKISQGRLLCMSNSYAFGGANVSLILGRLPS